MRPNKSSSHPGEIDHNVSSDVVVLVMDLLDHDAMTAAAQMSVEFHEVREALAVAVEVRMRLLIVAMSRHKRQITCMPVTEFDHMGAALHAICNLINAKESAVTWVMTPDTVRDKLTPHLEMIQDSWESQIQGIIH